MKIIILATIVFTVACAHPQPTVISGNANVPSPGMKAQAGPAPSVTPYEINKTSDVPERFKSIDFANMSYRTTYNGMIKLTAGAYEKSAGIGGTTISLGAVDYVDLDKDGQPEAIVQLYQLICGGSCDGSSTLFYFFSATQGKPVLLSRLEMGSVAYTCGLKSFDLKGSSLTLEAFRRCGLAGDHLRSAYDADEVGGKFIANEFTRFDLKFQGRRFVLLRRKVLPNLTPDIRNFRESVKITNG
jgi:hypothetical protein